MTFFLRNISLSALILALLVGALSVYVSSRIVYETMLNRIFSERLLVVEILGKTSLESASLVADSEAFSEDFRETLIHTKITEPGVVSFRVIDATSRKILASADTSEVGTVTAEVLPTFYRGSVSVELQTTFGKKDRVMISYLGANNKLLWMTIDQSFFINTAIVTGVQQAIVFFFAFGLFAFMFYAILRKFFMQPIRKLKQVLSATENEERKNAVIPKESFGKLLESFSDVAQRVESTLEHDKVISETKSDFISTTAHQLRTPLSGINWALGALLANGANLTEEQHSLIERASEKTKELVGIVGELLSAAGIEQGKFGFHPESVRLKEEIDQTILEEKELASKNKITLRFEHAEEEFPTVYVDKERIRWVIRNLIENAIRYGREGGEVLVTLAREHQKLLVSVKDNGIGIAPESQQHIFEKFFRSSEAKRKRNDGSGIGLFIVRNIINYHGGRIWFESIEGVGTTFFFTIPTVQEIKKAIPPSIGKDVKDLPQIKEPLVTKESPQEVVQLRS